VVVENEIKTITTILQLNDKVVNI